MSDGFNTEDMLEVFLYENDQLLQQLQEIVLEKKDEDCFDESSIHEIFRIMHTIKGSSAIMMYDNITKSSHKLEDIFYYLRESKPDNIPHMTLVEHILAVLDFIVEELDKIRNGMIADGNPDKLVDGLEQFLSSMKNEAQKAGKEIPPDNVYVEPTQFYIAPMASAQSRFYKITIQYKPDIQMSNVRAYTAVYSLKEIAEDLLYQPEDIISNESSADVILEHGFQMLLQAQADEAQVRSLIDHSSGVEQIVITECSAEEFIQGLEVLKPIVIDLEAELPDSYGNLNNTEKKSTEPGDYVISKEPGKSKQLTKTKNEQKAHKQSIISVQVDKMDALLDLIGELVIAQAVVLQNPDLQIPNLELNNFKKAATQLTKITSELQEVIMSMRMIDLKNLFNKMNRIVFDVSKKLGKEIELVIIGEDTEVDKNIIEHISDPLMHLIRNSVDHGIELVEERKAAGKETKGRITLAAKNEGGKVWIIVQDNGKGLNREKILAKAKANGLLEGKDARQLSDKEVYQFITYPGFSTKEKVTEYSGRGVGMDVVMKNIQAIGGSLEIDSVQGEGTTMTMKIPLTLAIINGIVMKSGVSTFVLETEAVKEFISARPEMMIHEPDGDEYIMIRGECYPVIRLYQRYGLADAREKIEDGIMILLQHEDKEMCMLVDSLIAEQEIVVKPIPPYIKKVKGISGCTQLGDGSIALILDPAGLLEHSK